MEKDTGYYGSSSIKTLYFCEITEPAQNFKHQVLEDQFRHLSSSLSLYEEHFMGILL
jgi:hypothetical protein